jgi:hypothetical protein
MEEGADRLTATLLTLSADYTLQKHCDCHLKYPCLHYFQPFSISVVQ